MHRSHVRICGFAVVAALGYLVLTGGSAGGFGVLIAALICPLAMILAMTVLMGHGSDQHDLHQRLASSPNPLQKEPLTHEPTHRRRRRHRDRQPPARRLR